MSTRQPITSFSEIIRLFLSEGKPFSGKSPGTNWHALSLSEMEGHLDYDHDAWKKPHSFVPLARCEPQLDYLFGVRFLPNAVVPCVWSRNRVSLVDCSPCIPLTAVRDPMVLKPLLKWHTSYYRAVITRAEQRSVGTTLSIGVEPMSPDLDASTRQCSEWVMKHHDQLIRSVFDGKSPDAWDAEAWLQAAIQSQGHNLQLRFEMLENAFLSALFRSSASNIVVGIAQYGLFLSHGKEALANFGAEWNGDTRALDVFMFNVGTTLAHTTRRFKKVRDRAIAEGDTLLMRDNNEALQEFWRESSVDDQRRLAALYGPFTA